MCSVCDSLKLFVIDNALQLCRMLPLVIALITDLTMYYYFAC